VEDQTVRGAEGRFESVRAEGRPPEMVGLTAVEIGAVRAMAAAPDVEAPAAHAADGEPGQQILGHYPARRAAPPSAPGAPQVDGLGGVEACVRGLPEVIAHDAQVGGRDANPVVGWPVTLSLHAPGVTPPGPIPDDFTPVERAVEDLADGRGRPASRSPE